jgi:hypothetical protein
MLFYAEAFHLKRHFHAQIRKRYNINVYVNGVSERIIFIKQAKGEIARDQDYRR